MSVRIMCAVSSMLLTLAACRAAQGPLVEITASNGAESDRSGPLCDWASLGSDGCNGKRVQIKARASEHIHQHPVLSRELRQSYWDTDRWQLIFLSAESLDCQDHITAIGILRARVGPCDPNAHNKNQYCGTALEVQSYECR